MITLTPVKRAPFSAINALDYPHLDGALWIWWHGDTSAPWPNARRRVVYLQDGRTNPIGNFALFTPFATQARTFETEAQAYDWIAIHESRRGHVYGARCTTVHTMRVALGYTTEDGAPRTTEDAAS